MKPITLHSTRQVIPMLYAYTTPEIRRHDGWVKIGYTEAQSVEDRMRQQAHTVDVVQVEAWRGSAVYDDGSWETFTDHDFHAYLSRLGIERTAGTEWFHVDGPTSKAHFYEFRSNRGVILKFNSTVPYELRREQADCVRQTATYIKTHPRSEFLWNAKPRFGKCLTTYDLVLDIDAKKVLIVTNRPAIANSWYDDYAKFIGRDTGYFFVSEVDGIKDKPLVISHKDFERTEQRLKQEGGEAIGLIEFVSLQDLKGGIDFGGFYPKLQHIARTQWDLLVIDEAHEGVDTYKTDVAFDHIKRNFTLHLSGTPFKALANDKFPKDAIYNWTYADEQAAKQDWDGDLSNPYANLPKLNMFTYQMSEIVRDQLQQGIEIDEEQRAFAFDLNEFFATKTDGAFVHDEAVDQFLNALTTQEKFPFSTPELRSELKHTFWLLNRIDSAKALAKKLKNHPIFRHYEVVLAAGDGSLDDEKAAETSFKRVRKAIDNNETTITLSVGQLTTGVTIPEWTAVLMLSSMRSPALYMQSAFRAQNPYKYHVDGKQYRKENAYVFDFDPARTLIIFEKFANDLYPGGQADQAKRQENIRRLLNFFPVIGEDENGEMIPLNAEKVLSIPRRIKSREVVDSGFRNNYLFIDAMGVIFRAPQEILDIINSFTPEVEKKDKTEISSKVADDLDINDDGDIELDKDWVIGTSTEIFGEKIFEKAEDVVNQAADQIFTDNPKDTVRDLQKTMHEKVVQPLMDITREAFGKDLRPSVARKMESQIKSRSDEAVQRAMTNHQIEQRNLERERDEQLKKADTQDEREHIEQNFAEQMKEIEAQTLQSLQQAVHEVFAEAQNDVTDAVETDRQEKEKKTIEDRVRDRLRGFSRTIPSFLMAYGDENTTLMNFDIIVPDEVFIEVTGVTLEDFRKLRDGGEYSDDETGETKTYPGLFDETVFNDSIRLFLQKRRELANYFDESQEGDIFDYIPPQKTNQIFTPKRVVKQMVDLLEAENPGCFDRDEATFADLYMKSGLYIAEIVKRLYQSEAMKLKYPDRAARLQHIFAHQVYGLAPTEIIHRIAIRFLLGFDDEMEIREHHLRKLDALQYAKEGTLERSLKEVFG